MKVSAPRAAARATARKSRKRQAPDLAPGEHPLARAALAVSSAGGPDVFQSLIGELAAILGVDAAFVAVFRDDDPSHMRTRAAWLDGKALANFDYALEGSPAAKVVDRGFSFAPRGVAAALPPGTIFAAKGMDCYAAYSLADASGDALGLLVAMKRTTIEDPALAEAMLKIFAVRLAAEIERNRTEDSLRRAALAVSSAKGDKVFQELVRDLASILGVDMAFIAQPRLDESCRFSTLAVHLDGRPSERFEYALEGTPCEMVIGQQYRVYPSRLVEHFPLDEDFARLGFESYAGFPLADTRGSPVGIISVVSRRPIKSPELCEAILKIFAVRASAEIERQHADEALRASEASYRSIFEAAEDPVFVHEWETGAIVDVNPAACVVYGRSHEEMLRITLDDLSAGVPPYTAEDALRHVEQAKTRGSVHFEWHRKNRDGSLSWDEVRLKRAMIGGKPRVLAFTRDITERRCAEQRLRASEEQYRAIFNASDDALILWDSALRRVDVNPAYERVFGWSPDEVIGRGYDGGPFSSDYAEPRLDIVRRSLAGETCRLELEAIRRNGERFDMEVRTIPIQYRGEPHVLAIARDITERKLAEERLRASEEQYRSIISASVDGMLLWDEDHRIVDANEAFLAMHGYRREDLVGQTQPAFIPAELQAQCAKLLPEILAGTPCHMEARSRRRDGTEFDVEIHGVPMQYQRKPHVLVIVRDVTARRKAEEGLRSSEEQYRAIFNASADGLVLRDARFRIVDINAVALTLSGHAREAVIGSSRLTLAADGMEDEIQAMHRRVIAGESVRYEAERRDSDGRRIDLEIRLVPVRYGGEPHVLAIARNITELHQATEALRGSEEQYRAIFNASIDGVIIRRLDGTVVDVNPAFLAMYGYAREELVGANPSPIIGPERRAQFREMLAELAEGRTFRTETPIQRKDGSWFHVEVHASPVTYQGEPHALAVVRDITQRKADENRLRATIEAALDSIVVMDTEDRVVEFNPAAQACFGYRREQVLGRKLAELIIPDRFRDAHRRGMARYLADGHGAFIGRRVEVTARRADGTEFPAELAIAVTEGLAGKLFVGYTRDITERKTAEEALRVSGEQYRAIFNAAVDALVLRDADFRIVDVNRAYEAMTGYTLAEVAGADYVVANPRAINDRVRALHERALAGEPVQIETQIVPRHGEPLEVELRGLPIRHQGKPHVLYIGRDITASKRAEAERIALESQLRQAQKMEAIGHLTGGIAHDFNNILTSVMGYVGLAAERDSAVADPKLGGYLEQALHASRRARDLIQQMLVFSRGQRGERRAIGLPALVDESAQLLRSTLPSSLELATELERSLPSVLADRVQLDQVLLNLAINARDAMAGAGRLTIRLHPSRVHDVVCSSCRKHVSGAFVELAVSDTGQGIGPEVIDRMFEPFFSTKEVGKGSGMGLAMVHGIVHDHGGHILVESVAGRGSTFRVLLPPMPVDADGAAAPSGGQPIVAARSRLSGHVLVVDDEESVAGYMKELLETWGLGVTAAATPARALDLFRRSPQRFDLVVTDLTMPGMTGLEVARAIAAVDASVPIILVTGYAEGVTQERLAAANVSALVRKPIEPDPLRRLLEAQLARGRRSASRDSQNPFDERDPRL